MENDPYRHDPGHWGASLATMAEIVIPCLDAVEARSVAEIGAYAGDVTRLLLAWAGGADARIWAVDPAPMPALVELAEEHDALELVQAGSHDALREIPLPDVVVVDGDHNYHTVSGELRLIAERAQEGSLPLLLFHDVCWPHARRDDYFDPKLIPEEDRHRFQPGATLYPGVPGIHEDGGLPFRFAAEHEGGERNGVLTAVEDFVSDQEGVRLAIVPAFFGLAVVWREDAPWAERVTGIIERWDRDPLLERLEANRVLHLASAHAQLAKAIDAQEKLQRQQRLLEEMLQSRAFTLAERLSWLHQRGRPAFTRERVRRELAD